MPRSTRLLRRTRVGPLLGAVAVVGLLVGCTEPPPPSGHPPQPNQTANFVQAYTEFRQTSTDPTKRPWFCHALGSGAHEHHTSNGVVQGPDYPTPTPYVGLQRGNLSWEDCEANAANFEAAKNYAMRYPTVRDAEAAGFRQTVQYLAGMGTHHQNMAYGAFNPRQPNTLQYDGDGPDARLIGMSWLIRSSGNTPPAGFPGMNDVWHRHEYLCYDSQGDVRGNNLRTSADCRAAGGAINTGPLGLWMVHAWIIPNWQYQTDVHSGMHPCLLENGPAPEGHECWAHAQHDHSTPPPDDGHEHGH